MSAYATANFRLRAGLEANRHADRLYNNGTCSDAHYNRAAGLYAYAQREFDRIGTGILAQMHTPDIDTAWEILGDILAAQTHRLPRAVSTAIGNAMSGMLPSAAFTLAHLAGRNNAMTEAFRHAA